MNCTQFIAIAILMVVTGLNYLRYNDPLYPPVLQGGLWTVILSMYVINQDMFNPLSVHLYIIITIGVIIFSIGSYLSTWDYSVDKSRIVISEKIFNAGFVNALFWVSVLGLPLFIQKAYSIGVDGYYDAFLKNLRAALLADEQPMSFGPLGYLITVSYFSAWMQILLSTTLPERKKTVVSIAVAMVYSFFATGRGFFIIFFIVSFGILLITRRIAVLKGITWFTLSGLIVFIGLGTILGKGASVEGVAENLAGIWDGFLLYLVGSLPAFDTVVHQQQASGFGENTFRFAVSILNRIGFAVNAPPLVEETVFVPVATNVYTVYKPYYNDFGYVGVIAIQLATGIWHGFCYKGATSGKIPFVVLYSIFLGPLFMQFFQDQYISSLSQWIQFSLLIIFCFYKFQLFEPKESLQCQN